MTFDPKRRLVMATFKTVLGHNLPAGTPLTIVDEPTARGEVDEAMARRLFAAGSAIYQEDHRPTPVETEEQERDRLGREALQDAPAGDTSTTTPPAARAGRRPNGTNAENDGAGPQGGTAAQGSTGPATGGEALAGADGAGA